MMNHPDKLQGKKRSPKWSALRKRLLKGKSCAVCGGKTKLELHHIRPFHLRPELELDPNNLIPLCEGKKTVNCHLIFGHFDNFRTKFNPDIRQQAPDLKTKMTAKVFPMPPLQSRPKDSQ